MPAPWERQPDPHERDFSTYRRVRREWAAEIITRDCSEEQWAEFKRQLRALGREMSAGDFIRWLSASWIRTAPADLRGICLREIAHRCDRIRVANGLEPLDDPLPPAESCFTLARGLIGDGITKGGN